MQFTIDTDLAIVGTILGLVAIVLAVPPLLQMLFGRAVFSFEADDFTGPDGRILVLAIKNQPVKGRLLRWMGVEREAADIIAFFGVQEHGTNKIIAHSVPGLLQCAPLRQLGLQARALPGFSVGLTVVSTRDGNASIVDARPDKLVHIDPGQYVARIAVVRGQLTYRIDQSFTVGKLDHETIWHQRTVTGVREGSDR
jgi:hypothetical protein